MNPSHYKMVIAGALILSAVLFSGMAAAGTVEGRIQGLQCVVAATICPVDSNDPRVAAERSFVLQVGEKSYYFVSNLDRADLAPYVTQQARITGREMPAYNTIQADKVEVYKDGDWHTTWSPEIEMMKRSGLSGG